MTKKDTGWYAITDLELRQFHFATICAGGSEAVQPVVDRIRNRMIDFHTIEVVEKLHFSEPESDDV